MTSDLKRLTEEYINLKDSGEEIPPELEEQIAQIPGKEGKSFMDEINDLYAQIANDPEAQRKKKIKTFSDNIGSIGNAAVNVGTILASIDQIRKSNKGLKNIKEPGFPGTQKKNQSLQQALNEARFKSSIGLDPRVRANLEAQNVQAAMGADKAAQTASTGQASVYGALSQGNYLNRLRNNLNLTGVEQNAINQALQREDTLRNESMQEDNIIHNQALDKYYRVDMPTYKERLKELADLGATGRQNLYNSLAGLPSTLSSIANTYAQLRGSRYPRRAAPLDELEPQGAYTGGGVSPNFFNIKPIY